MPLIATPAADNANSYCTAAEALVLLMPTIRAEVFDQAILVPLGDALIWATRLIEEQVTWRWAPMTTTQALGWPQEGAVNRYEQSLNATAYTVLTIDADDSDNSYNDSASGLPSLGVGDTVLTVGFATTDNNGVSTVVSRTTAKLVVSGLTLVTEATGASVTLRKVTIPEVIKRATAEYAFALLKDTTGMQDAVDFRAFTSLWIGDTKMEFRQTPVWTADQRMPLAIRRMLAPYAAMAGLGMQIPVYRG